MDYTKYTSINPDLTIHDLEGPIANVSASLLLDRRSDELRNSLSDDPRNR